MIVIVATYDPDTRDACERVIDLADYAPAGISSNGDMAASATLKREGTP